MNFIERDAGAAHAPGTKLNPLPPNAIKTPLQRVVLDWMTAHPDVSRRELARRAGIDEGDLGKICRGDKASLNMESAVRLAAQLGCSVEALTGAEPAAERAPAPLRPAPVIEAAGVRMIPLEAIRPSPHNPRQTFDKEALADLAASIAIQGLLQPLVVREIAADKDGHHPAYYELIAGERRLRALKLNKATEALCIVRRDSDGEARAVQIIENLQRQDISPIEEAEAFASLQALDPKMWSAAAIGRAIGKSDRFVAQRIAIATGLSTPLKKKFADGEISVEAARTLAPLPKSIQNDIPDWAIGRGDEGRLRQEIFDRCIPESAAKFDVALYGGGFIEDGKKRRYFLDIDAFKKLQVPAAEKKLEEVKKDWPAAKLVDLEEAKKWHWADVQYVYSHDHGVVRGSRAGDAPSKYLVPKDKCTAIVWIAANGEIRKALGVCSAAAIAAAAKTRETARRSSPARATGGGPMNEKPAHRKEREAFNKSVASALGKSSEMALRWRLWLECADDDFVRIAPLDLKKLVPAGLKNLELGIAADDKEKLDIWNAILKLPLAAVKETLSKLALACPPSWDKWRWKDKPAVMVAVARALGVALPAIALPAPIVVTPTVKKAAAKKKHP
jgi:ParB/RepB/Spo0J family partition protein